jgi:hypothetical protein
MLRQGSMGWQLLRWNDVVPGAQYQTFHDPFAAAHWLQVLQAEPTNLAEMRRCVAREVDALQLARMNDDAVITYLSVLLDRRIYRALPVREYCVGKRQPDRDGSSRRQQSKQPAIPQSQATGARHKTAPTITARPVIAAAARVGPDSMRDAPQSKARSKRNVQPPTPMAPVTAFWIEIELLGEDDSPIAAEPYRILLPNGSEASGALDARGRARIENIPQSGVCYVSFPRLDRDAWSELAASAARDVPLVSAGAQDTASRNAAASATASNAPVNAVQ